MSRLVRILQLRLLWPVLLLLAAFVIFFEFIADVGGSAEPQTSPPVGPLPTASPSPVGQSESGSLAPPESPLGQSLDR